MKRWDWKCYGVCAMKKAVQIINRDMKQDDEEEEA